MSRDTKTSSLGRRGTPDSLTGREIVVPGSTSNLGPGFDTLGLALEIVLRVRITAVTDDGRGRLGWQFIPTSPSGENAIEQGFKAGLATFGGGGPLPSLGLEVRSEIPLRAGLGSSAAALVAGLRLAEALVGPQPTASLLTVAATLEGHPDNTSASLLGGFVVACRLEDGLVAARATAWPDGWPLVVATPDIELATSLARAALPPAVPLQNAVFNLQRTALIVEAVHRGEGHLLRRILRDRMHQPHRASLVPGLAEALTWSDEGLLGVFLSGAGPSIAAVVDASMAGAVAAVHARFEHLYAGLGLAATVRTLNAHAPIPPDI